MINYQKKKENVRNTTDIDKCIINTEDYTLFNIPWRPYKSKRKEVTKKFKEQFHKSFKIVSLSNPNYI